MYQFYINFSNIFVSKYNRIILWKERIHFSKTLVNSTQKPKFYFYYQIMFLFRYVFICGGSLLLYWEIINYYLWIVLKSSNLDDQSKIMCWVMHEWHYTCKIAYCVTDKTVVVIYQFLRPRNLEMCLWN